MALKRIGGARFGVGMFPTDHSVFGPFDGRYMVVAGLDRHARAAAAVTG